MELWHLMGVERPTSLAWNLDSTAPPLDRLLLVGAEIAAQSGASRRRYDTCPASVGSRHQPSLGPVRHKRKESDAIGQRFPSTPEVPSTWTHSIRELPPRHDLCGLESGPSESQLAM